MGGVHWGGGDKRQIHLDSFDDDDDDDGDDEDGDDDDDDEQAYKCMLFLMKHRKIPFHMFRYYSRKIDPVKVRFCKNTFPSQRKKLKHFHLF